MSYFKNQFTYNQHLALLLLGSVALVSCGGGSVEPTASSSGVAVALKNSAATPPFGIVGTPYSFSYTATGSTPITYSLSNGTLPIGLLLSSSGVIRGIPTRAGTYTGTITASNGIPPDVIQNFTITVNSPSTPPKISM